MCIRNSFYSLKAFFADIDETGLVPDRGELAWGAQTKLPSAEQARRWQQLEAAAAGWRARLPYDPEPETLRDWRQGKAEWEMQRPVSASSAQGATLSVYNDEPVEAAFDLTPALRASLVQRGLPSLGDELVVRREVNHCGSAERTEKEKKLDWRSGRRH